jgi:hypothetical protein
LLHLSGYKETRANGCGMDITKVSSSEVEQFRDRLNALTALLHQVLKNPSLSKDPKFLHQIGEIICLLSELSKV